MGAPARQPAYHRGMALLYDRIESDGEVLIVFRRLLWAYPIILGVYLIAMFVFRMPLVAVAFIVLGLIVIIRDRRAIGPEVRAAAAEGRLTVTGSQWSLKNPMTYRIGPAVRRRGKGQRRTKKRRR